jgi:hypothetical protein
LPADQRVTRFNMGHRDFDPVAVGFITDPHPLCFEFRTTDMQGKLIPGHSNSDHGGERHTQAGDPDGKWLDFTNEGRRALVESRKTLH